MPGHSRIAVPLAFVFAFGAVVVGIAARFVAPIPFHESAAAVPSSVTAVQLDRYGNAVEESRQRARALIVNDNLPGLSIAVAINGEIVWAEGFGWSDAESRTPLTPRTRFRLGALSKPLTAAVVARLYEQGRVDLDAPVQRYVPAYPRKQWTVTTRQLMSDVAGVHRIRGDGNDAMPVTHCENLDQAVAMLADDPLQFQPGTQYRYSIWGWVLVSAVVQGAAEERFDRLMTRHLFEPLGMSRTIVIETSELDDGPPRYAPISVFGIRLGVQEAKRPDYSCLAGAGAFLSTPTDLVRFGSAMLKPGFLKADTIAAFETPTRLTSGASTTYALGWTVSSIPLGGRPTRMVSHRGSPMGGSVSLLTFPDLGLAVAAAANVSNAAGVNPLAIQVAEAFARR